MADASATKITSSVMTPRVSGSLLEMPNSWLRTAGPAFEQSAASEMLTFLGPDVVEGYTALRE